MRDNKLKNRKLQVHQWLFQKK